MDLKQWLKKRRSRIVICLILVAAILIRLCWPGIGLETQQPEKPSTIEEISEIDQLQMGENDSNILQEETSGEDMTEEGEDESEESETESEETETESKESETESEETESETPETESEETESEAPETESEETESEAPETESEETESETPETESEKTESETPETEFEKTESETPETESEKMESDALETESEESESEVSSEKETGIEKTEPGTELNNETEHPGSGTDSDTDGENDGNGDVTDGPEEEKPGTTDDEAADVDVAVVMTWYQYGTQPQTLACVPSEVVSKNINTAQLENSELRYEFNLSGTETEQIESYTVFLKEGDGSYTEVSQRGTVSIRLPGAGEGRDYTFRVDAKRKGEDLDAADRELTFTYVLNCHYAMDLELALSWEKKDGSAEVMNCEAGETVTENLSRKELAENVFRYKPELTGTLAEEAQIVKAEYTTASGESGALNAEGGSLILQIPETAEEEIYYLTFEVQVTDETGRSQNVFYHFTIHFADRVDVQLSFTWLEKGTVPRTMICQMDQSVSAEIKNNQLSAGAVKYEIALEGEDSQSARLLNLTYTSESSGGGSLEESGALPVTLPEGAASNTYTIKAVVLVEGKQTEFEIVLDYSMDVRLEMQYSVLEQGRAVSRTVSCENGKSKTAEVVYNDQLTDDLLSYTMSASGADASGLTITSVTCYQSGSGKTATLEPEGTLALFLKNGKTGENTFRVTAQDTGGAEYEFRINVPYKHRGANSVKITTNLTDGQIVTNDTDLNLRVNAWLEDESGKVTGYIPANGTDTKLIVKLDGEQISYVSTSGSSSEYKIRPENPKTGDTNTHTLYVYAEDAYGNFGELTLTLKGQRNQEGQKVGNATIYIDMSVLGLGVVGSVSYEVLADEPVSYAVAKAVLGMDTGEPFGAATNSLGWGGRYSGTLDSGFYLQSLSPGCSGSALGGSSWGQYGSSEKEILESIDRQFGKGTGLATLWRCIYRNGLNKSGGSGGSFGEFDYTSGSGWLYSLDGAYYPGQSMSQWTLKDGDVLTLRYTLAYGWDVGGGTAGYGNTVGYCVSAMNGSFRISHKMKQVENKDGTISYVCQCCGLEEDCEHEHTIWKDLEDGTHIEYCEDCKETIGDPEEHTWEQKEKKHICTKCGASEEHKWEEVEGSNTATCTEDGTRIMRCLICELEKEEESLAKGHTLNSRWNHTNTEHYQKCSTCGEEIEESRGAHQYKYDSRDDDWYCVICKAGHDWDCCGNDKLVIRSATCQKIVYQCSVCGMELTKEGTFAEYHKYENGKCSYCGALDPNAEVNPPQTDPPQTDPPQTDPPQTDPPQTDPPQTDPPQTDPPQTDPPQTDPPQTDPPQTDPPQTDPPQTDPPQTDPPQTDPPQTDPPQTDPPQTDPPQTDPPQTDPPQTDPPQTDPPENEDKAEE